MQQLSGSVFLVAGAEHDVSAVLEYLEAAGVQTQANADLYIRHHRQFGIDDAQELRARASTRAIGERRVFIISAGGMTSEAQNALLKTLEEPPDNALFIFIVPAPDALLATVRSRSQMIEIERTITAQSGSVLNAATFLSAPLQKRLDLLKTVLEKDDDDKYNMGAILAFLAALEYHVARSAAMMDLQNPSLGKETLEAIYRARAYATDRGALVTQLLGELDPPRRTLAAQALTRDRQVANLRTHQRRQGYLRQDARRGSHGARQVEGRHRGVLGCAGQGLKGCSPSASPNSSSANRQRCS